MFDLFRSRAKAARYLITAMLTLVALSMVITLIPGFGSSMGQRNDQIIAEIGGEALTSRMVNRSLQAQIRGRNMSPDVIGFMAPQIIQQMIGELATAYQAEKMGFRVSEAELALGIRTMFPQLFQGGQFVGKEVYQQLLSQMNTSIPEFEADVRKQILLNKLQNMVFMSAVVTPPEVEAEFQRRNEKVKVAVVKFDSESVKAEIKPTQAELEAHLKANQAAFMVPVKRDLSVLIAEEAKLGESIPVDEAAVRRLYNDRIQNFRVEERIHARHILVKVDQNAPADVKAKAKAKAEDLLKQIKAGADFAEMARKHSDDTGTASKGGDLDWYNRDGFVKPFADAAFALKPKEISGVVETEFGYHIIQNLELQAGRLKPFEEVKGELIAEVRREQLYDRLPQIAEQARAELLKNPQAAGEIAQKLNLIHSRVDNYATGDPIPGVRTNPELDAAINALAQGGVTPAIPAEGNRYAVAVALRVHPTRPGTLAEMQDSVRDSYVSQKAAELAEKKAAEFEARLKANNNDFDKTARELNAKVLEPPEFGRTGQVEGIGPAAYFGEQPFINPVGRVVTMRNVARMNFFYKITGKTPADMSKLAADRDAIVSGVRDRKLRERRELFEEGLVKSLVDAGEVKIYDDAIKRLIATYRS